MHVVHNGIDTELLVARADPGPGAASSASTRTGRSVVFVGRITRQKGLPLFLRAAAELPPEVQLVLCAGAPDTPEIAAEVRGLVDELAATRDGVVWIARDAAPRRRGRAAHRTPRCSSARRSTSRWASSTSRRWPARPRSSPPRPAASPRWSCDGETGWLVPIEQATDGTGTPLDPDRFVADLAAALIEAVARPRPGRRDGAGRAPARQRGLQLGRRSPSRPLEVYRSVGA